VVVKRLKPLPIEAVVRGYVIGSGWKDYQQTGAICGIALPAGLKMAARLPPRSSPRPPRPRSATTTNVSYEQAAANCDATLAEALKGTGKTGAQLCAEARDAAIRLYEEAAVAATRGIIIADTKFEFGIDAAGTLHLIDEALTPDSSRFWPADQYVEGQNPPSYDKQYVRDYLETLDWGKVAPGPKLPADVIARTSAKYIEAYEKLTGKTL
jgi:phosphoribosylaminoimidazole-succinocarboxamide synthase